MKTDNIIWILLIIFAVGFGSLSMYEKFQHIQKNNLDIKKYQEDVAETTYTIDSTKYRLFKTKIEYDLDELEDGVIYYVKPSYVETDGIHFFQTNIFDYTTFSLTPQGYYYLPIKKFGADFYMTYPMKDGNSRHTWEIQKECATSRELIFLSSEEFKNSKDNYHLPKPLYCLGVSWAAFILFHIVLLMLGIAFIYWSYLWSTDNKDGYTLICLIVGCIFSLISIINLCQSL